MVMEYNQL